MYGSLNPSVVSQIKLPGAAFQIVDYHWDAGIAILDQEPDVLLRWRVYPFHIKARGWVMPGQEVDFGRLMLHPAGVPTHGHAADVREDVRTLECRFNRDWLNGVTGGAFDWSDHGLNPCLDLRNGDIDHSMRRLMRELLEPGFASAALVEGLGISLAADIMRFFDLRDTKPEDLKGGLSPRRLHQIRDYVNSCIDGCPTLTDVAKQCGVSVAHIRRMYKSTTGQTLHDFIEEVRINRAKSLLLDTNLSLKVISYKLGFCHPSAFSSAFKRITGEAPRDFRNRCAPGISMAS